MDLCEMCRRLLIIVESQQTELERTNANEQMLKQWSRETESIKDRFKKIED